MIGTLRKSFGSVAVERRAARRAALHCPLSIRIDRPDAPLIRAVTQDLSSHGFSCVLDEPFEEGDRFECLVHLSSVALRCQSEVLWVKPLDPDRFVVGCRIVDYKVIP